MVNKEEKELEKKRLYERTKKKKQRRLTLKQKTFAKLLPICSSQTEAAVSAGYDKDRARITASELVANSNVKIEIEKNLKQYLNEAGLTDEKIGQRFHHLVDYNMQKVIRVVGEGINAREIEEMRDARVAASTLANVVKFKGASLENTSNSIIKDVNGDTAWLAIKSLVRKLSVEQVKELRDSCDAMLESNSKIVNEA